jgi:hypothetical protein
VQQAYPGRGGSVWERSLTEFILRSIRRVRDDKSPYLVVIPSGKRGIFFDLED